MGKKKKSAHELARVYALEGDFEELFQLATAQKERGERFIGMLKELPGFIGVGPNRRGEVCCLLFREEQQARDALERFNAGEFDGMMAWAGPCTIEKKYLGGK